MTETQTLPERTQDGDLPLLPTFEVDKDGLRKVLARKGMGWMIPELLQNAWDEDTENVAVTFVYFEPENKAELIVVDDDPDGFTDLAHAYTLFAESEKKGDAEKRGRFNVGEKLVVAACEWAQITTTTGTVHFDHDGRRMDPGYKTKIGSRFEALVPMTRPEYDEAVAVVQRLLPPDGVTTTFRYGVKVFGIDKTAESELAHRKPARGWEDVLDTEYGPELRRTRRKTTIEIVEPLPDETAMLYEMGIPIVETGDRWHVNISQKVPLNVERDNVTPAYLRDVRRSVLNNAVDQLDAERSAEDWTTDAIQDELIAPQALGSLLTLRFGEKRVAFDPSDMEANKIAAASGYTVVPSRTLPKQAWKHIKEHNLVPAAGKVTPSPKPYTPGAESSRATLPLDQWTDGMVRIALLAKMLATRLLDVELLVEIVNDGDCLNFSATYSSTRRGQGKLEFNLRTLGRKWFDGDVLREDVVSLVLHELGHEIESDHLSRNYYRALTDLGARAALLALSDPRAYLAFTAPSEREVI